MAAKKSCLPAKHAATLKRYLGPSEGEVIEKISHGVVPPSRLRALGLCDGEIDQLANAVASAAVSTNALFRLRFGERNVRTPRHAIRERDHSSDPAARRPFIKPEKISKRSSRRGCALPLAVCDSLSRASKENLPAATNDGERSRRAVRRLKWPNDQILQLNNGTAQSSARTGMQSDRRSKEHAHERTAQHGVQHHALQRDVPQQSGSAESHGSADGIGCDGGVLGATPCASNSAWVDAACETQALSEAILQPFQLHVAQTLCGDGVGAHDEGSVHAQLEAERRRRMIAQHALRECHRQLESLQLRLSGMQMGAAESDEAMDCPYTPYVDAPSESPFASPFESASSPLESAPSPFEPPYTPFQPEAAHSSPAGVICL